MRTSAITRLAVGTRAPRLSSPSHSVGALAGAGTVQTRIRAHFATSRQTGWWGCSAAESLFARAASVGHHCIFGVAMERPVLNETADANAALIGALRCLGDEFKASDLAAALLKSKNEKLLRNALASRIGAMLAQAPPFRVVREWGRGVSGLGRKRIDLAVLRGDRPVVLLEAKVAMSFDLIVKSDRRYPSGEVRKDIEKLRGVEFDAERYVLLLVTHNHKVPGDEYRESIPYFDGMERHAPVSREKINDGFERFLEAVGKLPVLASGEISAGYAFNTEVSVFWWLLVV